MRRGEHELLLRGVVELDESLLGGRERGSGKRGRTSKRKTLVAVSAEQTPHAAAELLSWTHIVISSFKRWQLDVFHGVSAADLQSYLDKPSTGSIGATSSAAPLTAASCTRLRSLTCS